MTAGQYQQAVGVLRQAVAAAPPSSLTYAYALYDLGRSLRSKRPVIDDVMDALPKTIELAVVAAVITPILAIPLGWSPPPGAASRATAR